ncbi:MAG: hypothetical protein J6575_03760 [Bifidobacterium sp.]|nr:hypothetical protein [Bifidobacterium sp.]
MESSRFSFSLECAPELVSVKAFSDAAKVFEQMLDAAQASDWRMADARLASIDFAASPVVEDDNSRESAEVLDRITSLASTDLHSSEDVEDFQGIIDRMTHIVSRTGSTLKLGIGEHEGSFSPEVVSGLQDEVRAITIKAARRSFGHVNGVVDKIILQPTHRSLGLVDRVTDQRIEVRFGHELDADVKALTPGTEVDVRGFVRSPEGLGKPSEIDAEDIAPVENRHHPLVTAKDLEGILAMDLPAGVDSVSIIRDLRDGAIKKEQHQ